MLPPGPLQLARNSYTEGLVFCCPFSEKIPRDLVTGIPGTPVGATKPKNTVYSDGNATYLATDANWTWPDSAFLKQLDASSFLWRGTMATVANYRNLACKCTGSGVSNSSFDVTLPATGTVGVTRSNAGGYKAYAAAVSWPANVGPCTFAYSVADGLLQTFPKAVFNGIPYTMTNGGGSGTGNVTDGNWILRIGRRADGAAQMDGPVGLFALWHRALSVSEMADLHWHPELLVDPVSSRTYASIVSAAAVTPHLLTTMGVGGMVTPSVGDTLAGAAGAALLRNPRVTRRRLLTGGQDGDD